MKRFVICVLLVLALGASAMADTEGAISVTPLDNGTFIIVQPINGGSVVELMAVRDGKLVLLDSYRYTRKSELGGEFSVEYQHVKKIEEK
jgi:hypothetical protein